MEKLTRPTGQTGLTRQTRPRLSLADCPGLVCPVCLVCPVDLVGTQESFSLKGGN